MHPRRHFLNGLAAHLLALKLALRSDDCLEKLTFWRFVEIEIQTFYLCSTRTERIPQINPKRKHTNNSMLSPVDFEDKQLKLKMAGV